MGVLWRFTQITYLVILLQFNSIYNVIVKSIIKLIFGFWGIFLTPFCSIFHWNKNRKEIADQKYGLKNAKSYDEWYHLAKKYDRLKGLDKWRLKDESPYYDYAYLKQTMNNYKRYIINNNLEDQMALVHSTCQRDFAGIINYKLYEEALSGTKELIGNFQKTFAEALKVIAETDKIPNKQKLSFFVMIKHTYGKTCVFLSGGGQLGFYHLGLMKVMLENKIYPKIYNGTSSGALIVAVIGCWEKEDLLHAINNAEFDLSCFPNNRIFSFVRKLWRLVSQGHILSKTTVEESLKINIGDITFLEAFKKTGRIINVTISDANG